MMKAAAGPSGVIRWGYRTVATFGAWSFDKGTTVGTVTAQVEHADDFGLTQQPLVVQVPVGRSQWRWPVLHVQRDGSTITISVGPMEA